MLVLSRKRDQEICVGDSVVLRILSIRGDMVKIGVTAPAELPVHRREVFERIQRETGISDTEEGAG